MNTLAGFVITVEQAIWLVYEDINANELLNDIETWLGCPADFPGISPAALDEAKERNVYELCNREEL